MKFGPVLPILAALVSLGACASLDDPAGSAGVLYGRQKGYMDGDTLTIAGARVRLHGIAAPERDAPGGAAATAYLAELVRGQVVTCALTGDETHGRAVGTCSAGGKDLQAELVKAGLARACPRYTPRYLPLEPPAAQALPFPAYCRPR